MASNCSIHDSIRIRAPLTRDDESSSSEFEYSNLDLQQARERDSRWSDRGLESESDCHSFDGGGESDMLAEMKFADQLDMGNIDRFLFDDQMSSALLHVDEGGKDELAIGKDNRRMEFSLMRSCDDFRPIAQLSFDDEITDDERIASESDDGYPTSCRKVIAPLRVKLMNTDEDEYSENESAVQEELCVHSQFEVPFVSGSEAESIELTDDIIVPSTEYGRHFVEEARATNVDEGHVPCDVQNCKVRVIPAQGNDFIAECDHILEERARFSADAKLIEAAFFNHCEVEVEKMGSLNYENFTSANNGATEEMIRSESLLPRVESFGQEDDVGDSKNDDEEMEFFNLSSAPDKSASPLSPSQYVPEVIKEVSTEEQLKLMENTRGFLVKFFSVMNKLGLPHDDSFVTFLWNKLVFATGGDNSAFELGIDDKSDLDISLNILVLGKTGVGKSAIINSVFQETKVAVNPFEAGTRGVNAISGTVNGVSITFVDTPGLKSPVKEGAMTRMILSCIKKFTEKYPPDVVLYVDRIDCFSRDLDDLPLLKQITDCLAPSIWRNCIVTLTHAGSLLPDDQSGSPLNLGMLVTHRMQAIQQAISQTVGEMQQMMPVFIVENNDPPSRQKWRTQLLLLCYCLKLLSESKDSLIPCFQNHPSFLSGSTSPLMSSNYQSKNTTDFGKPDVYASMELMGSLYFAERNNADYLVKQFEKKQDTEILKMLKVRETRWNLRTFYDSIREDYEPPAKPPFSMPGENHPESVHDDRYSNDRSNSQILITSPNSKDLQIGFSLMKHTGGQGVVASVQSQAPVGRRSKTAIRVKLNERQSGQIAIKTSNSDLLTAFVLVVPLILSVCRSICTFSL